VVFVEGVVFEISQSYAENFKDVPIQINSQGTGEVMKSIARNRGSWRIQAEK
jgi:hypothetical protein